MRTRSLSIAIAVLATALAPALVRPAAAAALAVVATDSRGEPVADAVVSVLPLAPAGAAATSRTPGRKTIDQKALAFTPWIETFRPGDEVAFRNSDRTRHHVYSFSPVKAFEFVLSPGEVSSPIRLDRAGVVAVGCNIHDQMIAYLYVSDAPWVARTDATGRVELHDLPVGGYEVRVWHPRLRPGRPDLVQSTTLVQASGAKPLDFTLSLLPDPRRQFDREHTQY